jgi:hypothetical protein
MNQQTLELLRRLQSSERDAQAFESIRSLLASQRSHLVSEDDRATLADLSELLEVWAETATPDLAAAATASAAQIADEDLEQAERAVQLYVLSLERAPGASDPLERLDALLCRRGERDRLESILAVHAKTLRERAEVDPERVGAVLRRLGQLRADGGGDVNAAIEAYEQALDLAADPDTIRALADLYAKRGAPGDDVQAADLYCTLGDVMGAPDGAAMLERALDQAPGHDAALDLLESYVPIADQPTRLKQRWGAYIERSNDEAGVDKRRLLLARAHAAEGKHREALICIGPMVDKGDAEALRLQAAFLANLHEERETPVPTGAEPQAGAAAKSGNGKSSVKRPATLVGFRLPPGEGVPAVAAPPPEATAAEAESAQDDAEEPTSEATQSAAAARNPPAARSGETLVGFRMPIGKTSVPIDPSGENTPVVLAAPATAAALRDRDDDDRRRDDRGSGERVRGSGESPRPAAQTARGSAASSPGGARAGATSSGTAAAAAARASGGPAALSAALGAARSSSPGTQPAAASAQRASSAARISSPEVESPAAKAAALKAGRSSSPPASLAGGAPALRGGATSDVSSPASRRVSSPPPLKRRSSGASPAASAPAAAGSAQPLAFGGPAALAATMPMPVVAPLPTAVPAPVAFPPADAFAASASQGSAGAMLPRSKPLEGELDAFATRTRKLDPRWLAAGGVAVVAVIIGVVWTSGGDPAPSDAARAETAPSAAPAQPAATAAAPVAAAAPSAAGAPTAAALPAAPATATPPPSSSATATLAAAVATNSAPAPATPSKRARAPEVEVGPIRVRGGLGSKAVGSAIDDGLSKIESCYADAIERKPNLEGKLTFSFNIDKSGKATRVRKQSGTIKDAALQRCSTEAIEKIRFPKAKKRSAQVTLPLAYGK